MYVIGLTGYEGSGKSTAAQYLVERHGYTRLSFAAPLKRMVRTLNPIVGAKLALKYGHTYTAEPVYLSDLLEAGQTEQQIKDGPYGKKYREYCQDLGTDCVRAEDPDFWINAAKRQMTDPEGRYVFDDCRFPNEAETIKALSPEGLWNVQRGGYAPVNGHISAQWAGKLGERFFLDNYDGDLKALHDQIDAALCIAFVDLKVAA